MCKFNLANCFKNNSKNSFIYLYYCINSKKNAVFQNSVKKSVLVAKNTICGQFPWSKFIFLAEKTRGQYDK